jgi:hypothetical protein
MDRPVVIRIFGEGLLIVVSILLALSADTWFDSRKQEAQLGSHVAALSRDFDTMLDRVNASHHAASRGVDSGRRISIFMQGGAQIEPKQARELLWHLIFYEVFSESSGAYQALVASGNLELLQNDRLKTELADFFGSFEDVRASEKLLLETQTAVFSADAFSQLAGWHRMGKAGVPVAGDFPVDQWSHSDEFMNAVGICTVRQADVLEDYQYLKNRIQSISAILASEASS